MLFAYGSEAGVLRDFSLQYPCFRDYKLKRGVAGTREAEAGRPCGQGLKQAHRTSGSEWSNCYPSQLPVEAWMVLPVIGLYSPVYCFPAPYHLPWRSRLLWSLSGGLLRVPQGPMKVKRNLSRMGQHLGWSKNETRFYTVPAALSLPRDPPECSPPRESPQDHCHKRSGRGLLPLKQRWLQRALGIPDGLGAGE